MDFKVRCIKTDGNAFTKDKIYEVNDKRITLDGGIVSGRWFGSVGDLNRFYTSQFELVADNMKKDQLKTGMWIEDREGERATILLNTNDGDIASGENVWMPLSSLRDDLTALYGKDSDVMKVFQPSSNMDYHCGQSMKLIWERKPELTEVTMQEIANWKGVPVESVRVKE